MKFRKPKVGKRKFPVLGQVRDVEGSLWDVRDTRDTKHGFELFFGSPVTRLDNYCGGLPRLIPTKPLRDFWEDNRAKHDGVLYDLPAGRTTLKRVRRYLGFHYSVDVSEFWEERIKDLETMNEHDFAWLHKVAIGVVYDMRLKLLGRCAREIGWWRKPRVLRVLRSGVTLREVGEKLRISISQAKRLRDRALVEL